MLKNLDMEYAVADDWIEQKCFWFGEQFQIDTFMPIIQVMHAEDFAFEFSTFVLPMLKKHESILTDWIVVEMKGC